MHGPIPAGLTTSAESTARIPLVSIVIPAFNVVPYLEACLSSVTREVDAARALSKADFEIIVVDDRSADATAELARDLLREREDARVVIHERNRGPAAGRNTGIDASRGDYILFLDSDNTLLEGALPRVVKALSEHVDADVIILGMDLIDEQGERIGAFYGDRVPANPLGRLQSQPFLLLDGNIMDAFCIISAPAARAARYDDSLCQLSDWDFYLRLHHEHQCSFAMLEDSVGGYRLRPGQLTQVHTPQTKSSLRETLKVYAKALAMATHGDLPEPAVQSLLTSVQKAGSAYLQLLAAAAPVAQPTQEQPGQLAPPATSELSTVELSFGPKKVTFAFRGNHAGDREAVAQIFQNSSYNLAQWAQGRRFLEHYAANVTTKPGLIIDAGANIGASAVYFLEYFTNAFVCAIESEPANFRILELNTRAYQNKTNLHAAIAANDGELCLENPGSSAGTPTGVGVRTRAISVPSILKAAAATVPMLFKCDIEGGEDNVFSGDPGWMRLFPVVIIGLHDWMRPFSGTSRNFIRAVAQHDFDFLHRGGSIFLFNRQLLA